MIHKAYDAAGYGNYIIIKDSNSNYAFLFAHMREESPLNVGDSVQLNQYIGHEGATGNVTGIHVHVEMQDYIKNGNKWIFNSGDSTLWGTVYLNAAEYMGFPNELGITVIYNKQPSPPIPAIERKAKKFNWAVYTKILRNKKFNIKRI